MNADKLIVGKIDITMIPNDNTINGKCAKIKGVTNSPYDTTNSEWHIKEIDYNFKVYCLVIDNTKNERRLI